MISEYEAPIWVAPANSESPRPMAWQRAVGAKKFFRGVFCSTKWRVGSDGCAIFLFVEKTRHSIRCPFSYLLRKITTSECSSFFDLQNRPVSCIQDLSVRVVRHATPRWYLFDREAFLQSYELKSRITAVWVLNIDISLACKYFLNNPHINSFAEIFCQSI